ncbi:uncharacterized protein HMPREF1541_06636 [Cyphellophora europaea CBS 101466]|uniref:Major facilitator superfamily (MFS) profile domain-containing protein n=1 Tax=Cyphellophora europaea (strain CBS 101466) TaxID=1220924 RepID=W2RSA3_CYPE1|nr:uncharacterized protein HMPREF1541_06636 [Cyphellophora europaea CBS 101466]ETN38599.1 hypothetical protein HMPREF1541_06636 [Cyphellophora europaea CBS 101466]
MAIDVKTKSDAQVSYHEDPSSNVLEKGDSISDNSDFQDDPERAKRILRAVDIRLVPVLTLLYLISFLDRSNIGNARVAGLDTDLGLNDKQYNMALTIFFFPYALFEVPSNIVLKLLTPRKWLTTITLTWGTVLTLMGIVQGYRGLLAARFFLGVAEAGFFPAATYILTTFYPKYELQKRLAVFYSSAALAGAFSGLLAFALQKMDGIGGLAGWRWIFIMEGIVTVVIGALIPFILIDSPATQKFLSPDDTKFYLRRLEHDNKTGSKDQDQFKWKYVTSALLDWKIYLSTLIFWGNSVVIYSFVFTLPTAIKDMGYTREQAQLLTIPIYTFSCLTILVVAYYADKAARRFEFICYPFILCAVCFIALIAVPKTHSPGIRYGLLFGVAAGFYAPLCGIVAWNANNLAGSWKRSVGMALQITIGNLGGLVGSNIYMKAEAPYYWTGYGVSLAVLTIAIICSVVMLFALKRINKKREAMSEEEVRAKYTDEQLTELGDKSPLFRYTL